MPTTMPTNTQQPSTLQPSTLQPNTPWQAEDSANLYRMAGWGGGYFHAAPNGLLNVSPKGSQGPSLPLCTVVKDALQRGFSLPLMLRFSDILAHRVHHLQHCFAQAAKKQGFQGGTLSLLPLKTNPQRQVVEEILRFGEPYAMGVEAGSKPELHLALAVKTAANAPIVFNGRKDKNTVLLALHSREQIGKNVHLVAETLPELEMMLALCQQENRTAPLGIRINLSTAGCGKWEDSGGDRSKFGLHAAEVLDAIALLKRTNALSQLRLVHVHLGSQMSHVGNLHQAMREAAHYYTELHQLGAPLGMLDIGGGLGVDYTGMGAATHFGVNYQADEFANIVCAEIAAECNHARVPHPRLATEHGRALTAHHSVLVLDVLEIIPAQKTQPNPQATPSAPEKTLHALISDNLHTINPSNTWQQAKHARQQANTLFNAGQLSLPQRTQVEAAFAQLAQRLQALAPTKGLSHILGASQANHLNQLLAQKWLCNFSVFQSLPDAWAIGQEFPIIPLQRLNEKPQHQAVLHDITCDSDGRILRYVGQHGLQATLPVHQPHPKEPYWLGVFLVGAYQEIMGDIHNLLGTPDVVHIRLDNQGQWHYQHSSAGQSSADVLAQMQFSKPMLTRRLAKRHQEAHPSTPSPDFLQRYTQELNRLTYPHSKRRKTRTRLTTLF